jgi:hypothetical protein
MSATYDQGDGYTVCISDEGLRRLANDNDLLAKTARTHERVAVIACIGIVIAIVCAIFRSL